MYLSSLHSSTDVVFSPFNLEKFEAWQNLWQGCPRWQQGGRLLPWHFNETLDIGEDLAKGLKGTIAILQGLDRVSYLVVE